MRNPLMTRVMTLLMPGMIRHLRAPMPVETFFQLAERREARSVVLFRHARSDVPLSVAFDAADSPATLLA
jgi:hypothetical protein